MQKGIQTICLYAKVHLVLGRMRNRVAAELDHRTATLSISYYNSCMTGAGLFHDDPSQRIPERMVFLLNLE